MKYPIVAIGHVSRGCRSLVQCSPQDKKSHVAKAGPRGGTWGCGALQRGWNPWFPGCPLLNSTGISHCFYSAFVQHAAFLLGKVHEVSMRFFFLRLDLVIGPVY